jgi:hypothetical protein
MTLIVDDSGQREQSGIDTQAGPLNRIYVNGESQFVIFQKELDPATALRKSLALPHDKHTGPFQAAQYFRQTLFFPLANENKLTYLQLRGFIDPAGQEFPIMNGFSPEDLIECAAKRVVSKDADSNWSFVTLKNVRGPFDEFCKVQKKRGFDLILDRRAGLGPG